MEHHLETPQQERIDFATSLYMEHLEEASFLCSQRDVLLKNAALSWLDIAGFEERFEAHLDALVIGEDRTLEVYKQRAQGGDLGELHAAVCVFCRQNRLDLVLEILESLAPQDTEKIQAIGGALNQELPESWEPRFVKMLARENQALVALAARLVGYRRINVGSTLLQALRQCDPNLSPTLIWAVGRQREPQARVLLLDYALQHDGDMGRAAAALALLRIGDPQIVDYCLRAAHTQTWPLLALSLGGGPSASRDLLNHRTTVSFTADYLLALGLLGDIAAVDILLDSLSEVAFAETAARSLQLITGAELYEKVFIPEDLDVDALFDDELERLRRGENLIHEDGVRPGVMISRLSQQPEEWQRWWAEHRPRFDRQMRYRHGMLYSPTCLLETLMSAKSSYRIRQLAYEELVIRYNADFPFETDMPVAKQKQAIAAYKAWISENGGRFHEGKWYFAGKLMP